MEHIYTYVNPTVPKDVEKACRVLQNGGTMAYPTDMNWAMGCDPTKGKAMERLSRLKPDQKKVHPYSILCSDISMASEIAVIENHAYRLLKKVWPGPFTVILPASRNLPRQLKTKREVVGVRIPQSELLQAIVAGYGSPMATTSVPSIADPYDENNPIRPPKFGFEVVENFGHALDLVLDLSDEVMGVESTVIDFSGDVPEIVRVGAGDPSVFEQAMID